MGALHSGFLCSLITLSVHVPFAEVLQRNLMESESNHRTTCREET